jgi:hypothetical protein
MYGSIILTPPARKSTIGDTHRTRRGAGGDSLGEQPRHEAGADVFADGVALPFARPKPPGRKRFGRIAAALNGRGIATARGGKWAPQAVANVLGRIG